MFKTFLQGNKSIEGQSSYSYHSINNATHKYAAPATAPTQLVNAIKPYMPLPDVQRLTYTPRKPPSTPPGLSYQDPDSVSVSQQMARGTTLHQNGRLPTITHAPAFNPGARFANPPGQMVEASVLHFMRLPHESSRSRVL